MQDLIQQQFNLDFVLLFYNINNIFSYPITLSKHLNIQLTYSYVVS